jgi:PAS domain S-box-containing protein
MEHATASRAANTRDPFRWLMPLLGTGWTVFALGSWLVGNPAQSPREAVEHLGFWVVGLAGLTVGCRALQRRMQSTTAALRQLAESEAVFRQLYEEMPLGYQSLDPDGRLLIVNATWLKMTGYSREEVIGQWFGDFLAGDGPELFRQRFPVFKERGLVHDVEFALRCRDGRVLDVSFDGRIVYDAAHRMVRTHCVMRDVTTHQRLAAELQQLADTTRALLGTTADAAASLDDAGRFLEVNDAYCRLTGYSRDELLGMAVWQLGVDVDRVESERVLQRVRTQGSARFERRQRTKSGTVVDFEVSATYVPSRRQFVVFGHDISARRKMERSTQAANARLGALVSSLRVGVLVEDAGRTVVVANDEFCRMFGLSAVSAQLVGANCREAARQASRLFVDPVEFVRRVEELLASGRPSAGDRLRLADGRVFERDYVPLTDIGSGPGTLWVYRDVTARQRIEEALEKRLLALTSPLEVTERIGFDELFNVADIQRLQDLFATATGVASIITHPDGTPITRPSNFTRLCAGIIRQTEKGRCHCFESDALLGRPATGPVVQRCLSGGLWDAGASIVVGGRHIANWVIGQVRCGDQSEDSMRAYAREIGANEEELIAAYREVPSMPRERFQQVADALYTFSQQLSSIAYQNLQQARFITERNRAEQALRESQKEFQETIEHAGAGYFRINRARCFEAVNRAWLTLHGFTAPEQIVGRHFSSTQVPEDEPAATAIVDAGFAGRTFTTGEFTRRLADGSTGYHTFSLHPVRRGAEIIALEGFLIDTTPLRRAQGDYKMLFDTMLDGFALHELITDAEGRPVDYRFLAVNPAFERQTGLVAASLVGRTVREVIPGIEPRWIETYGRVVATGEPAVFEEYARPLGRHFKVSAFRPAPGQFACVVVDITERKQAQEALAQAHDFHLRLLSQAPALIWRAGLDGKCDWFNETWLGFTGRTLEQERGDGWAEGVHTDDLQRCLDIYRAAFTARRPFEMEYRLRRHDGQYRWISDNGIPFHSVEGEFGGFIGYCFDITERRQAEERVREQAALLDVAHDGIIVIGANNLISYWNPAAAKLYEIPADDALGKDYLELVYPERPKDHDAVVRHLIRHGRWTGERQQRTRSGRAIDVRLHCTLVLSSDGQPSAALMVVADITEQKRMEAQILRSQRLESVGALASGVAHDLNNVLTPILMAIDLLRQQVKTPRELDLLKLVGESARRGSDVVQQLLLFSRGGESRRSPLAIGAIVRDVGRMMRETFPKNIALSVQVPTNLWRIEADGTQVHQAVLNLCVNARDAMPTGGRLTLTAENVQVDEAFAKSHVNARPGACVRIQVMDTGCGIPAANLDKIFDPFFTTKPLGQGTGLGLASVLGIVRAHGGFVTVRSEINAGSVFEAYFPAQPEATANERAEAATVALHGHGECILVIEDEEAIRTVLQQTLAAHHYEVLVASDGAEGLGVFAQHAARVQLVLTDVMMPVMDGAQTVRALRRLNPDLPVIAISGLQSHRVEFERSFGPRVRFLPKPFLAHVALQLVRESLDEAAPTQT